MSKHQPAAGVARNREQLTDLTGTFQPVATSRGGVGLYLLFFAMQTMGAAIYYGKGISFYRELISDLTTYMPGTETLIWSLSAIALMQSGYWLRYQLRPAMPRSVNPLLGHFVLFSARLLFVLPTAVFSFVVIEKNLEGLMPLPRYFLVFLSLFSLYCYTLELNRLGNVFLGQSK